jgi:hypothetical protein
VAAEEYTCGCGEKFTIPDEVAVVRHGATSHIEIDGVRLPFGTSARQHGGDGKMVMVTFEMPAGSFVER